MSTNARDVSEFPLEKEVLIMALCVFQVKF